MVARAWTGYHSVHAKFLPLYFVRPVRHTDVIFDVIMRVAGWDQLERIWDFVVGFFKFLWALLRLLGGG